MIMLSKTFITDSTIVEQFLDLSNFQQAWLKVSAKRGSPGIDAETTAIFKKNLIYNLTQLRDSVANQHYQPLPWKQVSIPKTDHKFRELKIPTIRDRIVQQALLTVLVPVFEPHFSACSFAYRPNLSYLNAVEKVAYWRDLGYHFVLDADLVKFFDNINQQRLLTEVAKLVNIPEILNLIKAWISVGGLKDNQVIKANKGIPQGAVISPLLANIYLNEFDHIIDNSDLKLVRYADDFLVLANSQTRIITAYYQVEQILRDFDLEIHPDKSQITNFNYGVRFLGHGFLEQAIFPLEDNSVKKNDNLNLNLNLATTKDSNVNPHYHQEMATIYLMEQGTTLARNHLRFLIHINKDTKFELPLTDVERILLFGNIHLTTPVINTCLQNKIIILFLNQVGDYKGHLWSDESIHLPSHLVQFERRNDLCFQLQTARAIVYGKLTNSKQLLIRLNRKRKHTEVNKAIAGINADLISLQNADNLDTLRGYEGISAARYFPAFGQLITNPDFSFCLRTRQPPKDAVNSLLSFGYTLLFNNVLSLIIAEGLSPYLANFHYGDDKKPYLAFDLMEEFRSPIVDTIVIKIINKSILKSSDFQKSVNNEGIYISDEGKRLFLKHFENRMNEAVSHPTQKSSVTYRQAIQLQIRRYKQSLFSDIPYESFLRSS